MEATIERDRRKLNIESGGEHTTRTVRRSLALFVVVASGIVLATSAQAVDIGVPASKFIVIDKLSAAGKAKAVFVAKDVAITKGAGMNPDGISVTFDVHYNRIPLNPSEDGTFFIPTGASDGTEGWVVNKDTVAKFVNKGAPTGSTTAKVAVIKPQKLLKLVAKERGDFDKLDIFGAGPPPSGGVQTAYCVTNGGSKFCHCTEFSSAACTHKVIAGGTGAKLVCKAGVADPGCGALCLESGESCNNDGDCCSGNCFGFIIDTCVLF